MSDHSTSFGKCACDGFQDDKQSVEEFTEL